MTDQPDPQRHPKMVAAAVHLAQQGFEISRMPMHLGKGGKYRWKADATSDPALIPNLLAGAHNSVVIPRGETVVIDADKPDAAAFLSKRMPPGFRVASPTEGHFHFYARIADPSRLPDVYEGGEVRRDPGGKDQPGGAGGMVIGPWSRTDAGVYQRVGDSADIPELPEVVVSYLQQHSPAKISPIRATNGHATDVVIEIREPIPGYELPDRVGSGNRYAHIRSYTASLYNRGFSTDEMWGMVLTQLAPRFEERLSDQELGERFKRAVEELPERLGERAIEKRRRAEQAREPVPLTVEDPRKLILSAADRVAPPIGTGDWLVNDLIRPGTMGLLAAATGLGKSVMRTELTMRLAVGQGALFDHYGIAKQCGVLVFDGENGESEEWLREEDMADSLGIPRAHLGFLWRVNEEIAFALDLNDAKHQQWVEGAIATWEPDVVVFDTIGTFTRGVEWGPELHKTVAFLRGLTREREGKPRCSVMLLAHPTKVERYKGQRPMLDINDVMGQWVRFMDWAVVVNATDTEGKVRWQTFKRIPRTDLILEQQNGRWVTVVANVASPISEKEKRHQTLLGALLNGPRKVKGKGGLKNWLELTGDQTSERTVERDVKELAGKGLAESDPEGVWSITGAGRSGFAGVRLVVSVEEPAEAPVVLTDMTDT